MTNTRWIRWGDAIPAAVCLLLAGGLWWLSLGGQRGGTVRLTTPTETVVLSLESDTRQTVTGADGLSLTVIVENGRACVEQADCPDQVCVHTGWLSAQGHTAACLPAQILVTIEGATNPTAPDAVAR